MGDITNGVVWEISNPNYNGGTAITLGSQSWATPSIIDATVDSAAITIKFVETIFTNSGTLIADPWRLVYSEMNGSSCVARRYFDITPALNEFKIFMGDDDAICNSYSSGGINFKAWNNTEVLTTPRSLAVPFTVSMSKNANHNVKEWIFQGTVTVDAPSGFTIPAAVIFITSTTGSSTYGSYTITNVGNDGTFTMTVKPDLLDPLYTVADAVDLEFNIIGNVTVDVEVSLTISNAVGISGTNFRVETDDTGTLSEHNQVLTLYGIPNTSIISVAQN